MVAGEAATPKAANGPDPRLQVHTRCISGCRLLVFVVLGNMITLLYSCAGREAQLCGLESMFVHTKRLFNPNPASVLQPPERSEAPVTFKPGTSTWSTDDPSQAAPWVRAQARHSFPLCVALLMASF